MVSPRWCVMCNEDPFRSDALFCFIGKGRDKLKILYWSKNGFVVWYKVNASAATTEVTKPRPMTAAEVTEAIEHVRVGLLQIQAMLKCLYEVLLYADDDDSVMHADVANVCARLVNESVCRLGDLQTRGCEGNSSHEFGESG